MTVNDIMDVIDRSTEPSVMTKREALNFLDEIATEIGGRMEALRDEILNEEQG